MRDIPPEIKSRCSFRTTKFDPVNGKITNIKPQTVCECGESLTTYRTVTIGPVETPYPHWREHCNTCKLCRVLGTKEFVASPVLNFTMIQQRKTKDK